jgi:hypothetical protein
MTVLEAVLTTKTLLPDPVDPPMTYSLELSLLRTVPPPILVPKLRVATIERSAVLNMVSLLVDLPTTYRRDPSADTAASAPDRAPLPPASSFERRLSGGVK